MSTRSLGDCVLSMNAVSKVYRTDVVETHALRDINLHVARGELVAIVGPSGSGKTTFLNVAGLLEAATSGDYLLNGMDVGRLGDRERSRLRNRHIGYVFQGANLIPDLDIYENLEVPLLYRRLPADERRRRIDHALWQVGLQGRARHRPSELSGGQQQRAAIARALAGQPDLLLADEPTGNLDSTMAEEVVELLLEANRRGTTTLLVTHDQGIAARAHRKVQIVDGVASGTARWSQGNVA